MPFDQKFFLHQEVGVSQWHGHICIQTDGHGNSMTEAAM